ncbi:MAG: acetyl-CoA carboxylase carboxyltransferase subunit beta, partial [Planctomycetota bacterium]
MTRVATRGWTDVKPSPKRSAIPEGLWLRCPSCAGMIYRKQMEANLSVCPDCGHHFRIGATTRVEQLLDSETFERLHTDLVSPDPLGFEDLKTYRDRLLAEQIKTGQQDAVIAGTGFVRGRQLALACLDLTFMMGSMGSVVGEVLTRTIETATERDLPLVIVSCSGGARMQESGLSLMQMAKTSAALAR